jgi:hypothetical protein
VHFTGFPACRGMDADGRLSLPLYPRSGDLPPPVGIFYPPTALFVVGFGFVLLLLLYFSTIISKLSVENNSLTQQFAILDWRVR